MFVYDLNNNCNKLSNDRTIRVRAREKNPCPSLNPKDIEINSDHYYAVIYDDGWYIGKVLRKIVANSNTSNSSNDVFEIIFLKENLNEFYWPKRVDKQLVKREYIFFGSIGLIGFKPFNISKECRENIIKMFKIQKQVQNCK